MRWVFCVVVASCLIAAGGYYLSRSLAPPTANAQAAEARFRSQQLRRMRELFALKSIDERLVDEKTEQRDAAREAQLAAEAAVVAAKAQVTASAAKIRQAESDVAEAKAEVK